MQNPRTAPSGRKVRFTPKCIIVGVSQTSVSLGFIEQVKFKLFEIHKLQPIQARVFSTSEILFKSTSSIFKIKNSVSTCNNFNLKISSWIQVLSFLKFLFKPH